MRTLIEVQTELSAVNAAIQSLLEGKRVNEFRVGSGEFIRTYRHTEVNLDSLRDLRNELLNEIASLTPCATPVFRCNATIPLVVHK